MSDNTALAEAARRAGRVVPVFILGADARRTGSEAGGARRAFLLRSLEELRERLRELGYRLIVRRGRSEEVLPKLCQETGAEAVFANKRYEPDAQARDGRVFSALNAAGLGFELFKDAVIWEEQEILTQAGKPFTVFTPYSKVWKGRAVPLPRGRLRISSVQPPTSSIPDDALPPDSVMPEPSVAQSIPPAGERAAQRQLRRFMAGPVYEYAATRNCPATEGTSQLSPHLGCGTIGIRSVLAELKKARAKAGTAAQRESCDVFLSELIWREFYVQVLHNFPHVTKGAFRAEYDALPWSGERDHFQAWCEGMTGYPMVDAAMRCLNRTGWMHNRLRMIVAMFLTKDLLISWQWGERYFMQRLVDGDLAANNGGWQWSAGTGTDAAPYFRIFNPVSQGEKFDPGGEFVRRWVPELGVLPDGWVHQPWRDAAVMRASKYCRRVVLHEEQRSRCLAMFSAARKGRGPTVR